MLLSQFKCITAYQEDIKPWLGGAMFAMLPNRKEDNLLVVLGIKNKLKALSFLKKIEKQEKQYLEKIDYQGVTIFENTNLKKNIPYAALVDNKLIISQDYQSIKQAIDAYQNKDSLANLDNAQQTFSEQTDIKNPLAEIYFTNYAGLIKTFAPPEAL